MKEIYFFFFINPFFLQFRYVDVTNIDLLHNETLAEIGSGVFFDHATGLVIGETAKVGDNCTILHGVTLGGTGKNAGDRHPKIGDDVLIGAGTSILGNIKIGDGAKIGAGSIVLKPIPHGVTAVGAPAKIIGWAKENRPGSRVDNALKDIVTVGNDSTSDTDAMTVTKSESTSTLSSSNNVGSILPYKGSSEADGNRNDENASASLEEKNASASGLEEKNEESNVLGWRNVGRTVSERRNTSPVSCANDNMCIFRMFSSSPQLKLEQLSYKELSSVMGKQCSEDQIGEIYMELLKNDPSKRYVSKCQASTTFSSIVQKYTKMEEEQCKKMRSELSLD